MVVAYPRSMDDYLEDTTKAEPETFEAEVSRKNVDAWG
jgi:hypothetical protein